MHFFPRYIRNCVTAVIELHFALCVIEFNMSSSFSLPFLNKLSDPLALVWLLMHISSVFSSVPCLHSFLSHSGIPSVHVCSSSVLSSFDSLRSVLLIVCLKESYDTSKFPWCFEINKFSTLWKHTVIILSFSPKKINDRWILCTWSRICNNTK